jgi:hypothetical protein
MVLTEDPDEVKMLVEPAHYFGK